LTNAVVAALALVVVADLAEWDAVLLLYTARDLLARSQLPQGPIDEIVAYSDDVEALRRLVVYTTAILFLVWFYQSYRNLHRSGLQHLTFSPSVAVAMFFIPILNLVVPYQVMSETWRGSRGLSRGPPVDERWKEKWASPMIAVWWLVFLLSGSLRIISGLLVADAAQSETALSTTWASPGAVLVDLLAAVLAIRLVLSIARFQDSARSSWPSATGSGGPGGEALDALDSGLTPTRLVIESAM
jgi:hypothetical protein